MKKASKKIVLFISVALLLALSVPSVFGITENATTSYDVSLPAFQQHATLREGNRPNNKANVYAYNRITKPNCTAYIWFDKMVDDNIYQATERQFCSYNATTATSFLYYTAWSGKARARAYAGSWIATGWQVSGYADFS